MAHSVTRETRGRTAAQHNHSLLVFESLPNDSSLLLLTGGAIAALSVVILSRDLAEHGAGLASKAKNQINARLPMSLFDGVAQLPFVASILIVTIAAFGV